MFLHEGLGCVALWRDFPAELARRTGCGALVYSRAGYGGSDPVEVPRPLTYMHDEGIRVLPEVLQSAGVKRAFLVGHSDGGSIALLHAGAPNAFPGLAGLLLEAPHVFCEDLSVASIALARDAYLHGDFRARLERYHGTNVDWAFWGWNRAWLDPAFRQWNIEASLPTIRVPVLVMQGADDEYGTLAQVDAIARQCGGPVETSVLEKCGHSPHKDQRELTPDRMTTFIQKHL